MQRFKTPTQFAQRKGRIDATVLKVIDPAHYILKESPSLNMSAAVKSFLDLEGCINEYYSLVDLGKFHLPGKDEVVVVLPEGNEKFYRAKVNYILGTTTGPRFSVYLVDYGKNCQVPREGVFKILDQFLQVPFQAVHFHLLGLKPLSLSHNPEDFTSLSFGPSEEWDESAVDFSQDIWKDVSGAQIEVLCFGKSGSIHGNLYIELACEYHSLSDVFIRQNFAYLDEKAILEFASVAITDCRDSVRSSCSSRSSVSECEVESSVAEVKLNRNLLKELMSPNKNDMAMKLWLLNAERQRDSPPRSTPQAKTALQKWHEALPGNGTAASCAGHRKENFPTAHQEEQSPVPFCQKSDSSASPTGIGVHCCQNDPFLRDSNSSSSCGEHVLHSLPNHRQLTSSSSSSIVSALSHAPVAQTHLQSDELSVNHIHDSVHSKNKQDRSVDQALSCPVSTSSNVRMGYSMHCMSVTDSPSYSQVQDVKGQSTNEKIEHRSTSSPENAVNAFSSIRKKSSHQEEHFKKSDMLALHSDSSCDMQSDVNSTSNVRNVDGEASSVCNSSASCSRGAAVRKSEVSPNFANYKNLFKAAFSNRQRSPPQISNASEEQADHGQKQKASSVASSIKGDNRLPEKGSFCEENPASVSLKEETVGRSPRGASLTSVADEQVVGTCREANASSAMLVNCDNKLTEVCSSFDNERTKPSVSSPEEKTVTHGSREATIVKASSLVSSSSNKKAPGVTMSNGVIQRTQNEVNTSLILKDFFRAMSRNRSASNISSGKSCENASESPPPTDILSTIKPIYCERETNSAAVQSDHCSPVSGYHNQCVTVDNNVQEKQDVIPMKAPSSVSSSHAECALPDANGRDVANEVANSLSAQAKTAPDTTPIVDDLELSNSESPMRAAVESEIDLPNDSSFSDIDPVDVNIVRDVCQEQDITKYIKKVEKRTSGMEVYVQPYFKTDLDFSDHTLFDKQGIPVVQIGIGPPKPILCTEEAAFVPELDERLNELKFWGPSCIQSVAWPAVFRGRSFAAVAPSRSGKTVAYLLPLLSNIIQRSDYLELPASNGPLALILCSSWRKAQIVNEQIQLFLGTCGKVAVITLCNDATDSNQKHVSLLNGCDILIATPSCLLSCLEKETTNFDRFCHFFIDDGDNIVKYHKDKFTKIMGLLLPSLKAQKRSVKPLQIVICVEHWTRGVSSLVKKYLPDKLLFFTSFIESAVYTQVPTYVQMCQESTKMSTLLSLLDATSGAKTVICTTTAVVAAEVHKELLNSAVYAILAHEAMTHFDLVAVKRHWACPLSADSSTVLVLTDAALISMNICDANVLIHFDLPEMSRLQFSYRFGCIADSFLQAESSKLTNCVCHILVTEACRTQAPSLVSVLQRMGCEVPAELKIKALEQKMAERNASAALCHYFKSFGSCNQSGCRQRHTINKELDMPKVTPSQGDIRAEVKHVYSASHYNVKILAYLDPVSGSTVSRTGEYAKLTMDVQDFYSSQRDATVLKSPEVGILCCVEDEGGMFHRCEVMEFVDEIEVKLFFVDEGWVRNCPQDRLYTLPEKLTLVQPFAAEVYLCNVMPSDPCPDWNPKANNFVFELIGGQEVHAKIMLCLGNTLFLSPLVIRESELSFIPEPLNLVEVGKSLKRHGYAVANKNHMSRLNKACKGKIDLPVIATKLRNKNNSEVNWAFLDNESVCDVYVCHVESPHRLYVQKAKSAQSLDKLTDEIAKKISQSAFKRCQALYRGLYCLAQIPEDGRYYRGEIVDLIEKEGDTLARVFFVDFGDWIEAHKSDLFVLPKELMLLPFQAIECELDGVSAPHGGWAECAADAVCDLTRDDENCLKMFRIKAWKKTVCFSGGNHYVVDIFNSTINFSEFLIKSGFAIPSERLGAANHEEELNIESSLKGHELSSSDDDSSVCEDRESSAMMCGVVGVMRTYEQNDLKFPSSEVPTKESKSLVSEESSSSKFLNQKESVAPTKEEVKKILEESSCKMNVDARCLQKTMCDSCNMKAPITWWNTLHDVNVTVHIAGIEKYDLEISAVGFNFSSCVGEKSFMLNEKLYAEILSEHTETKCLGNRLELVFKKKCPGKWPRLVADKEKVFYIKYDWDHWTDSDSENAPANTTEPKESEQSVHYGEDDTDTEKDSSEDEYYAPSWTKLCEAQNPYEVFS